MNNYCANCGAEIDSGTFCPVCGAPVNQTEAPSPAPSVQQPIQQVQPQYQQPAGQPIQQTNNSSKLIVQKPWFWVIIFVFFAVAVALIVTFSPKNSSDTYKSNNSYTNITTQSSTVKPTLKETESPTELPTEELSAEDSYKLSCVEADYKTLARNPDENIGIDVKVTGKVDVVTESADSDDIAIVLNISDEDFAGYYSDGPIWIYGKKDFNSGHIIEYQIITVWGTFEGMQKQQEYMHEKEYPGIQIKYIEFKDPVAPSIDEPVEYTDNVSEKDFKDSCIDIDFINLARYPTKYINKNIKISGEVYYVKENIDGDIDEISLLTKKDTFGYDYGSGVTIRGIIKDDNRILKDDIITVWGIGDGLEYQKNYSAEPVVQMKYYQIEE